MKRILSLSLVAGLVSCSADEGPVNPSDSAETDRHVDAGIGDELDSHEHDAGAEDDAGPEHDAGSDHDDGHEHEAGPEHDTGTDDCDPSVTAQMAIGAVDTVAANSVTSSVDSGLTTLTIDASAGGLANQADNPYVYLDLSTMEQVMITDIESFSSMAWWLAFKRSSIRVNSGDSGPGPLLLARVDSAFEDASSPPPTGDWMTDEYVDEDCEVDANVRGVPASAFGQWYDYNPELHQLSAPENTTFFVYNAGSHAAYRIAIDSWEDGVYQLRIGGI